MTTHRDPDLPLVQAVGLEVRYGASRILADLRLDVAAGEQVAITGRSGSGKTTLLLVLAGLLAPTSGTVTWPGLGGASRPGRGQVGMVFQAPSLMPELTAVQNVALPLRLRGIDADSALRSATAALARVSAAELADGLPSQLSGGQQQRVAIARALAGEHRLVLADEPTGALDRVHAREITEALRAGVRDAGGALVLATHDPELAAALDRRLQVVDGRLVAEERVR